MNLIILVYVISCLIFLLSLLSIAQVIKESSQGIRTKDVQRASLKVNNILVSESRFFLIWPVRLCILSFLFVKNLKK